MNRGKTIHFVILGLLLGTGAWQLWPEVRASWLRVMSADGLLIPVPRNDRWGYIDRDGHERLPCRWEQASEFNPYGLAAVKQNGRWNWIDRQGKFVVKLETDYR